MTWAEAAACTQVAAGDASIVNLYIGLNIESVLQFVKYCEEWAKYYKLSSARRLLSAREIAQEKVGFLLQVNKAGLVVCLAGFPKIDPSLLIDKQLRITLDDAAFSDDILDLPQESSSCCQLSIISAHNGINSAFNAMLDASRHVDSFSVHELPLDTCVDQGWYRAICEKEGRQWNRHQERKWVNELIANYKGLASEDLHCMPRQESIDIDFM